jgi:thiol-disulfide isomerase/thioredoxin
MRPPRQVRLARSALVLLMGVAIGLAAYAVYVAERVPASSGQANVPPALAHGAKAPAFSLARLGGGPPVTFTTPRGRPVVLQFFASWCQDCLSELQAFATASRTLGDRARFIGVDSNDSRPSDAERLLKAAGDNYPTAVDPYALVANRYLVGDLPATVFIDPAGRVVDVAFGAQTAAEVEHWATVAATH